MRKGIPVLASIASIVGFLLATAPAQDTARTPEIWQKDVVILVDVSKSVDPQASKDAREIIEGLVQARYELAKWKAQGWEPKPSAAYPYFGQILRGTPGSLPLMHARKFLLVMQIGSLATVKATYYTRPIAKFPESFVAALRAAYPRQWNDNHTHYRLAQARAYDWMSETANREGYYLFVVSDAEDDPGPELRRYDNDDRFYLKRWEQEKNRDEVMARLEYDVSRSAKKAMKRFSIILYAVGFNPKETPPVAVAVEPVPEPVTPNAPSIQLLGGLAKTNERRPKEFREATPFLAWQVANLPIEQRDFQVVVKGKAGERIEAPKDVAETRIKLPALANGDYTVEVRSPPESPVVKAKAFIRVRKPRDYTRWIAAGSALASLGVFAYAWLTLRQAR